MKKAIFDHDFFLKGLLFFWGILCYSASSGQTTPVLQEIKAGFDQYQQNNLREKLFVHTDKNFYLAGELLWFKIYMVDGTFNRPLDLSKVAYLEILDQDNKPLVQIKIELKEGSGSGSVHLPVSASSGNYKLRAYTNWMKNFSPELYFSRSLSIVNTLLETGPIVQRKEELPYSIQFFPEGGNLVQGITSKLAFRVLDKNGNGKDCEGLIVEQQDTVARFKTLKFGIGSLLFTPKAGKIYSARIRLPDGQSITEPLPRIYEDGYVLRVRDQDSSAVKITVSLSGPETEPLYLLVHAGQQVQVAELANVNNRVAEFLVPKRKLREGVVTFTVFNHKKQAVCERLYYHRVNQQVSKATLKADKQVYGSRKNVTIDLALIASARKADLSMSVYRLDSLEQDDQASISDYINFSSELKGRIESPGYYFRSSNPITAEALDNVMLTHGWRRFDWASVLMNTTPAFKFLPEYSGHIISGKVTGKQTGQPVENVLGFLSSPAKRIQLYTARSNRDGLFNFYVNGFYAASKLVLQGQLKTDSAFNWIIASPFSSEFAKDREAVFTARPDLNKLLYSRSINVQVQNSFSRAKMNTFSAPQIDTSAFYGEPTKVYQLDDYTRFGSMEEVLREYVLEIGVNVQRKNYSLKVSNDQHKGFYPGEPLVLLDGVPVFNGNKIIQFDPIKVKSVEALTNRYLLGTTYFEGIASFSTYNGDLAGFQLDPSVTVLDYEGLQLQRIFHSPDYAAEEQYQSTAADFRDLLYWNPSLKIEKGTGKINFYTSDQNGTYRVVLQGIGANGTLFNSSTRFDVMDKQ